MIRLNTNPNFMENLQRGHDRHAERKRRRYQEAVSLHQRGHSAPWIARHFRVTPRTVYRYLREYRDSI